MREGKGSQLWPDGSLYEGDWKENSAWGLGKLTNKDGSYYEGQWMNNHANGIGVFVN
jgi:hypothetical protein